jgi:hypothetical protein
MSEKLFSVEICCGTMENSLIYGSKQFETKAGAVLCADTIRDVGVKMVGTVVGKDGSPSEIMFCFRPEDIWSITILGPGLSEQTESDTLETTQFGVDRVVPIELE